MMESKLRKVNSNQNQICIADYSSSLAMHKDSKPISKTRNKNPKIRIIHMFPPRIIETEAQNFRELVQSITGKPPPTTQKKPPTISSSEDYSRIRSNNNDNSCVNDDDDDYKPESMKNNSSRRERSSSPSGKEEEEEEVVCGGGYLGGFSDLEQSFISELPLLPFDI